MCAHHEEETDLCQPFLTGSAERGKEEEGAGERMVIKVVIGA
jgi:hypothetical protein